MGPLARSARDLRLLMDIIANPGWSVKSSVIPLNGLSPVVFRDDIIHRLHLWAIVRKGSVSIGRRRPRQEGAALKDTFHFTFLSTPLFAYVSEYDTIWGVLCLAAAPFTVGFAKQLRSARSEILQADRVEVTWIRLRQHVG